MLGTAPMIPPPTHGSAWEQLVTGAVVVEMSTLHEVALEADVVDINILHDGVNVTVCVDVSITVDTTGCGMSTGITSSVN